MIESRKPSLEIPEAKPDIKPVIKPEPKASGLVRMTRDAALYPAPHEADVHPAEVEQFMAGGWVKNGADRPTKV